MGTVKHSQIKTSNGAIEFNSIDKKIFEIDIDNFEYLRVYEATAWLKLYINHSSDYIVIKHSQYSSGIGSGISDLILEDFQINHIKVEIEPELYPAIPFNEGKIEFYLCK